MKSGGQKNSAAALIIVVLRRRAGPKGHGRFGVFFIGSALSRAHRPPHSVFFFFFVFFVTNICLLHITDAHLIVQLSICHPSGRKNVGDKSFFKIIATRSEVKIKSCINPCNYILSNSGTQLLKLLERTADRIERISSQPNIVEYVEYILYIV